jgi:hypothetical protein
MPALAARAETVPTQALGRSQEDRRSAEEFAASAGALVPLLDRRASRPRYGSRTQRV